MRTSRYILIARRLRAAIDRGRYPVGARLPTEHALCEQYDASRFTIREAIRILAEAGLVRRRPRIGTVVTALPGETRYSHGITSLHDLSQYARSTHFQYLSIGRTDASGWDTNGGASAAERTPGARRGEHWIYAVALRRSHRDGPPFGITRLYLNPALKGIERKLRGTDGPVYALIERDFGVRIDRVEQVISSVLLECEDAAKLGVPAGTPGLAVRRSYFDEDGRLLEMADTVHPADRFAYRMELRR